MSFKRRSKNSKRQSKIMVALCAAMVLSTSQLACNSIFTGYQAYAAETEVGASQVDNLEARKQRAKELRTKLAEIKRNVNEISKHKVGSNNKRPLPTTENFNKLNDIYEDLLKENKYGFDESISTISRYDEILEYIDGFEKGNNEIIVDSFDGDMYTTRIVSLELRGIDLQNKYKGNEYPELERMFASLFANGNINSENVGSEDTFNDVNSKFHEISKEIQKIEERFSKTVKIAIIDDKGNTVDNAKFAMRDRKYNIINTDDIKLKPGLYDVKITEVPRGYKAKTDKTIVIEVTKDAVFASVGSEPIQYKVEQKDGVYVINLYLDKVTDMKPNTDANQGQGNTEKPNTNPEKKPSTEGKKPGTSKPDGKKDDTKKPEAKPAPKAKREVSRLKGNDRIKTAIEVSKANYKKANTVIIARGDNYADALSSTTLAKALNAPILLSNTNKLAKDIENEIKRLDAKEVIIVGGKTSISDKVEKALNKYDSSIERISGSDRYSTSAKVAEKVVSVAGNKKTAILATGSEFADSLSVSPFAAKNAYPILLVKKNTMPESVKSTVKSLGISNFYVAGGNNSVGDYAEKNFNVKDRFAGKNRFETAAKIAEKTMKNASKAYIVSGEGFADALVAGPLAATEDAPILLVKKNDATSHIKGYLKNSKIQKFVLVGGYNTITKDVESSFVK